MPTARRPFGRAGGPTRHLAFVVVGLGFAVAFVSDWLAVVGFIVIAAALFVSTPGGRILRSAIALAAATVLIAPAASLHQQNFERARWRAELQRTLDARVRAAARHRAAEERRRLEVATAAEQFQRNSGAVERDLVEIDQLLMQENAEAAERALAAFKTRWFPLLLESAIKDSPDVLALQEAIDQQEAALEALPGIAMVRSIERGEVLEDRLRLARDQP